MRPADNLVHFIARERSPEARYLGSIGVAISALLITGALHRLSGSGWIYLVDVIAAIVCSLYGGFGPGLLGTLMIAFGLCLFFIMPGRVLASPTSILDLSLFVALSGITSWMLTRLRSALRSAEASAEARDQVIAIVSHDLRDPLGSILLSSQAFERRLRGKEAAPAGEVRSQLQLTIRSINKMNRVIEDLFESEGMEAKAIAIHARREDLGSIIEEAYALVRASAVAKEIHLLRNVPEIPTTVLCDRERIREVLANLLENAIKFTAPGGTVGIQAEIKPDQAVLTVWDSGRGISSGAQEHVFERFWHDPPDAGLGLGLYVASQIIQGHGGRVSLDSQIGRGSRFSFRLPIAEEHH